MEITKRKTLTGSRYLSFVLNDEEYGIEILKIKEIMGMTEITSIPQTPPFIRGVINLRGKIIPIIDLRLKFEMDERDYTDRTCIIVVEIEFEGEITLMGIVVDSIQEVVSIPEEKISEVPYINSKVRSEYIHGIAETGETIKIILDITQVLTEEEFVMIRDVGRSKMHAETKKADSTATEDAGKAAVKNIKTGE
ncbi:MAG: purine-binding chemotaxis protein CheW [Spirochaetales bacterium]|nr:purine-binding chemotaxis protein CheW [Spirochaetales bacterium]